MTVAPLALAYVSVSTHAEADSREEVVAAAGRELAAFASREGYTLAGIFSDVRGRSESGLHALLEAVRRGDAVAVVVPDLDHLRHVGYLSGADLRTVIRYLRARLLTMVPDRHRPARRPTARTATGARR